MNDVVISGLGVISPIGNSLQSFWETLLYGKVEPQSFSYSKQLGETLIYTVCDQYFSNNSMISSRTNNWALLAVSEALRDANIPLKNHENTKVGVVIGNNSGDMDVIEKEIESEVYIDDSVIFTSNCSAFIAENFNCYGPNLTISNGCSAGLNALSMSYDYIRNGIADVVITGGIEASAIINQALFYKMRAVDYVCRPFDISRNGTITSEGAAILVIESEEHARKRGFDQWYAKIKGYEVSCDGYHICSPDPQAIQITNSINGALTHANLSTENIDLVIPHGTGTILNDKAESIALSNIFIDRYDQLAGTAIKSKMGHPIGASGAFSCIAGALILKHGLCPPTLNLVNKETLCPLYFNTEKPVKGNYRNLLINSFAFGGSNASVVLGR